MTPQEQSIVENKVYNLIEFSMMAIYSEIGEIKFSSLNEETQNNLLTLQNNLFTIHGLPDYQTNNFENNFIYPDPPETY